MTTSEEALALHAQGYAVIPLRAGTKRPVDAGWQSRTLTETEVAQRFASDSLSLGVLNGLPSAGLVDIDLDCPEALALAARFLPPTEAVFGRASTPRSHWLYRVDETVAHSVAKEAKEATNEVVHEVVHEVRNDVNNDVVHEVSNDVNTLVHTAKFIDPVTKDTTRAMLVELRSTGTQTLFPPSIHPSGEVVEWVRQGDPAHVDGADLRTAVQRLAAAALLSRHWPSPGSRQDAALALAGGLLRAGWTVAAVEEFIAAVAAVAGDEQTRQRVTTGKYTARRLQSGQQATGWPTLAGLVGDAVVGRVRDWLDVATDHSDSFRPYVYGRDESNTGLHFRPLAEAMSDVPDDPPWLVEGYVAPGVVTVLAGAPKAGKSELLMAVLSRLLEE